MLLHVLAPDVESARALARCLCPGRRLIGDPVVVSPTAGPEEARRFIETAKTLHPYQRQTWSLKHAQHR